MSNPEDDRPDRRALSRLDEAVGSVLQRLERMEERLRASEERRRELDELLEEFRTGDADPMEVSQRAQRLAEENEALRRRLEEGRVVVERIRARIRFLEEQR